MSLVCRYPQRCQRQTRRCLRGRRLREVNVDNFVRAETDRMFAALSQQKGRGREPAAPTTESPASIHEQPVIRENRYTLCSSAVVDIAPGRRPCRSPMPATATMMVVNNDHYINDVLHEPGDHDLTVDQLDTDYVLVGARILVDPNDSADLAAVHELQNQMALPRPGSDRPFAMPDYDQA